MLFDSFYFLNVQVESPVQVEAYTLDKPLAHNSEHTGCDTHCHTLGQFGVALNMLKPKQTEGEQVGFW